VFWVLFFLPCLSQANLLTGRSISVQARSFREQEKSLLGFTKFEWWLNYLKALPLSRELAVLEGSRPLVSELGQSLPYVGSIYDPVNHRTWFLPYNQTSSPIWHYLDGRTGKVVAYAHGKGGELTQAQAYLGGVYDPVLQRIYLVPTVVRVYEPLWHYIDCETAEVVSYFHGRHSSEFIEGGYVGGVYDPLRQRIVLIPAGSSSQWHYIDCQTGDVQVYTHGHDSDFNGLCYYGGVYDPVNSRVYFVLRCNPESSSRWHDSDCLTGLIEGYSSNLSSISTGGSFDPLNHRIYFMSQRDTSWASLQLFSSGHVSRQFGASVFFNQTS
jgi:hypothetical protein